MSKAMPKHRRSIAFLALLRYIFKTQRLDIKNLGVPQLHGKRYIINNILYEVALYEENHRTIVCEDVNYLTVKGYFDEERMAYYTSEGYKVILDSCTAFGFPLTWSEKRLLLLGSLLSSQ